MVPRTISTLIILLSPLIDFGQQKIIRTDWTEYFKKIEIADSLYHHKEYLRSAQAYSDAFLFNNQGFSTGHRYQAACAWAMAGKADSAILNLKKEFEVGFYDYDKLKNEKALYGLHGHKDWSKIKNAVKQNQLAENKKLGKYKDIKPRLEKILVLDQMYRANYMETWQKFGDKSPEMVSLGQKMLKQDQANLKYVSEILDKYGWISYDTIGFKANQTLFLVIQHSDSTTQEKYLPLLKQAVKDNRAFAHDLALLEDRVLIKRGSKQIYGSQIQCDSAGKNCWILPIEDEINVDKRRADVGLQPLAEYVKTWNIEYKKPG
jgi:hypothetical protein